VLKSKYNSDRLASLKAYYSAESGVEIAKKIISDNSKKRKIIADTSFLHFFGDGASCSTSISNMFGYIHVSSLGRCLKQNRNVYAVLGQTLLPEHSSALTLMDSIGDLILAGNSDITGDVLLGEGCVRKSVISEMPFIGDKGHNGKQINSRDNKSSVFVEQIDTGMARCRDYFSGFKKAQILIPHSIFIEKQADISKYRGKTVYVEGSIEAITNDSFDISGPVTFIIERQLLVGQNIKLRGINFIVNGSVTIKGDALVEECYITSFGVSRITDDAKFSGSIISSDTLIIDKRAHINHPSFLFSVGKVDNGILKGGVLITDSARVFATVLYKRDLSDNQNTIAKKSLNRVVVNSVVDFKGVVISCGSLELAGRIIGHVSANELLLSKDETVYKNMLFNTKIDRSGLAKNYVLPMIFNKECNPQVISLREYEQ